MKPSIKVLVFGVQVVVPFFAIQGHAFTTSGNEAIVQLKGRNGSLETCAIPVHFDESRNRQLEKDRGDEAKLCRMALSSDATVAIQEKTPGKLKLQTEAKEFAVCPKLNSTNQPIEGLCMYCSGQNFSYLIINDLES